jgi:hypothetical protein
MLQTTPTPLPSAAGGPPVPILRSSAAYAVYLTVLLGLALVAIWFGPDDLGASIVRCCIFWVVGSVQPALRLRRVHAVCRVPLAAVIGAVSLFLGTWVATLRHIPLEGPFPEWMAVLVVFVATLASMAVAALCATRVWKDFPTVFSD